jgi:F-type H+-transporting ATPase subunit delta
MAEFDDFQAQDARAAAEIEADVRVEHIGDVYAKSLLDAAESTGETATVLTEFDALVTEVLDRHPKAEAVLASALVSHDEKVGIIDRVFAGRASPLLIHFLKVLSRHDRLDCLRVIHRQAKLLYDKMRGRIRVEFTTALPLDSLQARTLTERFGAVLGGEPVVQYTSDPQLIGGAVVRIGDTVYDGSVANQLKMIRDQMMDRSAHEIQSRRDRFRYPAGN